MNWNDIERHWPRLKRSISADHPELDADDLERSPEGRRRLLQPIEGKYGSALPMAEEDLDLLADPPQQGNGEGDGG